MSSCNAGAFGDILLERNKKFMDRQDERDETGSEACFTEAVGRHSNLSRRSQRRRRMLKDYTGR